MFSVGAIVAAESGPDGFVGESNIVFGLEMPFYAGRQRDQAAPQRSKLAAGENTRYPTGDGILIQFLLHDLLSLSTRTPPRRGSLISPGRRISSFHVNTTQ